jgi:hypothetical protein
MAKNSEMKRIEVMLENHEVTYQIPLRVVSRSAQNG